MKTKEVRDKYLEFYKSKEHALIPSSPLIPENDPTTLFTGSGMQPLIPFLLGEKHPQGVRLANSQKCFRSGDINDIGDNRHTTFFEMLGNWSLGSYFKNEQLPWVFEFLTSELKIPAEKIFVTVFKGDEKRNIPKDIDSVNIWKKLFKEKGINAKDVEMGTEKEASEKGMMDGRIFYYSSEKNWWSRSGIPENMPVGELGGPDSEIFYEFSNVEHDPKFGKFCHPNCDCGRFLEIGNSVFMEYIKNPDQTFGLLSQKNVDFGGGLERMVAVTEDKNDIFLIDIFSDAIKKIEELANKKYVDSSYISSFRVILDHIRSAVFLISDGILPGNIDQSYFVRRLIRRSVRHSDKLGMPINSLKIVADRLINAYSDTDLLSGKNSVEIINIINSEEEKFRKTLENGIKELNKEYLNKKIIDGDLLFSLLSTHGFPADLTLEIAKENNYSVDENGVVEFEKLLEQHRNESRSGSEKKFKGGLADNSEMSTKYHTATHILHEALSRVLGPDATQKGSNITPERLRFDFSWPEKMTDEQKHKVEQIVNDVISKNLPVKRVELPKDEANRIGAKSFFAHKYGDVVSVYYIGENIENAFSKEFCGGPHVSTTGILGKFKIIKEEAVSNGVRRIKAILE